MPIPRGIVSLEGSTRRTLKPSGKLTILLHTNSQPTDLRLDPDGTIVKERLLKPHDNALHFRSYRAAPSVC